MSPGRIRESRPAVSFGPPPRSLTRSERTSTPRDEKGEWGKARYAHNSDRWKLRCVVLAWSLETAHPAAWADLVNKIKENVLVAFDTAITAREEEVRRSEGQRTMPGWNFCTFFVLKVRTLVAADPTCLTKLPGISSFFFRGCQVA
jgi:hypothetical protein